jgi:3-hydroxyisobutyrate dehydrogenase-like beta-hydroxyacid dehydrogenase
MSDTVGFVGLGQMGQGMAANLLRAGFGLCVYNRTPGKAKALVQHGVMEVRSPGETVSAGGIVLSMLTNDQGRRDFWRRWAQVGFTSP